MTTAPLHLAHLHAVAAAWSDHLALAAEVVVPEGALRRTGMVPNQPESISSDIASISGAGFR